MKDATKLQEPIAQRLDQLLGVGDQLSRGEGCRDDAHQQECVGWITAAFHIVDLLVPSPRSVYRQRARAIAESDRASNYAANLAVGQLRAVLKELKADVEAGLIASVANQARAETFDDFLDHAEAYYRDKRKNEAGTIAGITFEDTIRRICRTQGIEEDHAKLDYLVSELVKAELLSAIKAKRARAAAGLRTSAAHARWDEFELSDVKPVIDLTRELIAKYLAT